MDVYGNAPEAESTFTIGEPSILTQLFQLDTTWLIGIGVGLLVLIGVIIGLIFLFTRKSR
jgi:hypothetical protein